MPKRTDPTKPSKGLGKKKTPTKSVSMSKMQKIKEDGKKAHLRSSRTRKSYSGYIARGQEWMASHFSDSATPPAGLEGIPEVELDEGIYNEPEFRVALDGRPTKYSDKALALWIAYKCFFENLGIGTCDGAYSAFKRYWEEL